MTATYESTIIWNSIVPKNGITLELGDISKVQKHIIDIILCFGTFDNIERTVNICTAHLKTLAAADFDEIYQLWREKSWYIV